MLPSTIAGMGGAKAREARMRNAHLGSGWVEGPSSAKDGHPGAHIGEGVRGEGVRAPRCLSACLGNK